MRQPRSWFSSCLLALTASFVAPPVLADIPCGALLGFSTELTADMDCPGPGPALTIVANAVVLKLNGHQITARGSAAIEVSHHSRFALQGPGRVYESAYGVHADHADLLSVTNVDFDTNFVSAVSLVNSRYAVIQRNRFYGDGVFGAIAVRQPVPYAGVGAGGHAILDNEFELLDVGISLCGADAGGNRISGNSFGPGVSETLEIIDEASRNVISGNKFRSGTAFLATDENQFFGNVFEGGVAPLMLEATGLLRCFRRSGAPKTLGNTINKNIFRSVTYPILVGDIIDGANSVQASRISENTIYDADTGITFGAHAYSNNARGNTYIRTRLPVRDDGWGNVY